MTIKLPNENPVTHARCQPPRRERAQMISEHVQPGSPPKNSTALSPFIVDELDAIRPRFLQRGAAGAKSICTSVNHVVCHGIRRTGA
jgi:methionine aminopeptidase